MRWKISRLNIFGIKTASSILIIFQRAKQSRRSVTHRCWCRWGHFEWKRHGNVNKVFLFSHDNDPAYRALQPRRSKPTWDSSVLITHTILRIWPRSLEWKINLKVAVFLLTRYSLLPRRLGWTDNILNFLSGLQRLQQLAKECIELREKYVEQIPSMGSVACFLSDWAKYLSAPTRTLTFWNMENYLPESLSQQETWIFWSTTASTSNLVFMHSFSKCVALHSC